MKDGAVKVIDAERGILGGWGIPFGGPMDGKDLEGEFFDEGTDLCLDWFPEDGRPVLYEHGMDSAIKSTVIGRQISHRLDPEAGIWAEAQLNMAHRYADAIMKLAGEEALGFSSGAMKHLVAKEEATGRILRWPWVEQTLTVVPANPYGLIGADAVKHLKALGLDVPEGLRDALEELKTAIAVHHTATSGGAWDGPANEARLRGDEDAAYYAKAYAWRDPEQDGTAKAHFRFIHHEVSGSGEIGAANLTACSSAIGVLNGGRGGTTIPSGDRRGVYNHLAAHLRDGEREPPELRSLRNQRFIDHVNEALACLEALGDRAESLVELRAEEGRGLSEESYKRLAELGERLDEVLRKGEPPVKGLEREHLRFLQEISRGQGVPV